MIKNNAYRSSGFSLVELMVVLAIIGILTAVVVPAYMNHVQKTRLKQAQSLLLDVKNAQEMFYAQQNRYCSTLTVANFQSLLSFDPADSTYFKFAIDYANASSFCSDITRQSTISIDNSTYRITQNITEPVYAAAGCP